MRTTDLQQTVVCCQCGYGFVENIGHKPPGRGHKVTAMPRKGRVIRPKETESIAGETRVTSTMLGTMLGTDIPPALLAFTAVLG